MPVPSIALAASRTSSTVFTSLTPPALPRPPAWICALTTQWSPPMARAASAASWAVRATRPGGTGMPASAKSCLAWYSWKFMGTFERSPRARRGRAGCGREGAHCRRERPVKAKAHALGWPGRDPRRTLPAMPPSHQDLASPEHRELYFFALFRVLEAGILGIVAFTPLGQTMADIRAPILFKLVTFGYFLGSGILLYLSLTVDRRVRRQAATGLLI